MTVMAPQLMGGDYCATSPRTLRALLAPFGVFSVTVLLATVIIAGGAYYTTPSADLPPVDRETCGASYPDNCRCWDGRFKGLYNAGGYKSVFYNFDEGTPRLILVTLFFGGLLLKHIERCLELFVSGSLRLEALVVSSICFSSLFYGWGCLFNYINDRFWSMFWSQMFYAGTELVPCAALALLVDRGAVLSSSFLFTSLNISAGHIFIALADQGLANIGRMLTAESNARGSSIAARDILFLVCDTLATCLFLAELRKRHGWASIRGNVLTGVAGCVVGMKVALWLIRAAAGEVV